MPKKATTPAPSPAPSPLPTSAPPPGAASLLAPLPGPAPTGPPAPPAGPPAGTPSGPGDPALFEPTPLNLDLVENPDAPPAGPAVTPAPNAPHAPLTPEEIARRREENTSLRTQLEESNRVRTERENELATERSRIAAIEAERDRVKTERESLSTEFENFRKSVVQTDPMKDDRVVAISKQFDGAVDSLADEINMEGGNGKSLRPMIPDLLKKFKSLGPSESEGFDDRRRALNDAIETNFPDHAKDVRALLRNGIHLQDELHQRITHLQKNGSQIQAEREREQFTTIDQHYSKREQTFFKPAPETIENDPFNSEVICTQLLDSSDEAKARKGQILKFCRAIALPPAPVDPDQLAKMTLPEQATFFQNRNATRIQYHDRLQTLLPTALASQILLPSIYKELLEARKELLELRGSTPPPPNGQDIGAGDQAGPTTIKEFKPANTALDEFQKG